MTKSNQIALFDPPTAQWTYHRLPEADPAEVGLSIPVAYGCDTAPDDTVWWSQLFGDRIGHYDPADRHDEGVASAVLRPSAALGGSGRHRWVPGYGSGVLGRFDPTTERWKVYPMPTGIPGPAGFGTSETPYNLNANRQTGQVWINGSNSDTLIRFEPKSGRFTAFPLPTRASFTREIEFDADNNVWTCTSNEPSGRRRSRARQVREARAAAAGRRVRQRPARDRRGVRRRQRTRLRRVHRGLPGRDGMRRRRTLRRRAVRRWQRRRLRWLLGDVSGGDRSSLRRWHRERRPAARSASRRGSRGAASRARTSSAAATVSSRRVKRATTGTPTTATAARPGARSPRAAATACAVAREECDDGNTTSCDGCSGTCTKEEGAICGDGIVNAACGEECDPPQAGTCACNCRTGAAQPLGTRHFSFGGALYSSALGTSVPLGLPEGAFDLVGRCARGLTAARR